MVDDLKLQSKVIFVGVLPYQQMMEYTRQGFLGLIFEKIDVTDEHLFALPNKFFDYLQAGIPVLSSEAVEIKSIMIKYKTGDFIDSFDPPKMAKKVIEISENKEAYDIWKRNTIAASKELNWENEEKSLVDFMHQLS